MDRDRQTSVLAPRAVSEEHSRSADPQKTLAQQQEPRDPQLSDLSSIVSPRRGYRGWIGLGGAVVILGVVGFGVWQRQSPDPEVELGRAPQLEILSVATLRAEPVQSYSVNRSYTGEIQAQRTSELGFERSGKLISVSVEAGERVQQGQILAQLDTRTLEARRQQAMAQRDQAQARLQELQVGPRPEQIERARAAVADLEEQLALSQLQQQRRQDLYAEGAISREQLDQVAFATQGLGERLRGAQSQLEELLTGTRIEQISAQQAQVEQWQAQVNEIEVELSQSQLQAPFSGRIGARHLDEGMVVAAGQSVLRLVEDGSLEARIGVPVGAHAALPLGSQHQIWVNGQGYGAEVTGILPEIEDPTRTVTVVLTLAAGAGLTVGETARLQLQETVQPDSVEGSPSLSFWVPTTALVPSFRGLWSLYSLRSQSEVTDPPPAGISHSDLFQVSREEIEILHTEGDQVLVRGTLHPGDLIVQQGVQRIVADQWVTVQADPPLAPPES